MRYDLSELCAERCHVLSIGAYKGNGVSKLSLLHDMAFLVCPNYGRTNERVDYCKSSNGLSMQP